MKDGPSLYDRDFLAWIAEQNRLLLTGEWDALDVENIVEELDSMARSDRRSVRSHFVIVLMHLLKMRYQPARRSRSWLRSVLNGRDEIEMILNDSPSLRGELPDLLREAYPLAVRRAARETNLPPGTFPADLPFTLDEVMNISTEQAGNAD